MPGRIGWGWLAARLVRPAILLTLLGIGMAGAAALAAAMDPDWPTWLAALAATGGYGTGFVVGGMLALGVFGLWRRFGGKLA